MMRAPVCIAFTIAVMWLAGCSNDSPNQVAAPQPGGGGTGGATVEDAGGGGGPAGAAGAAGIAGGPGGAGGSAGGDVDAGQPDAPAGDLVLFDPLTDDTLTTGEAEKSVRDGAFGASGWQVGSPSDQIMIRMATPLKNPGTLEIDVTNFSPPDQIAGDKHEIINLYTQENGSKAIFDTDGSWWNIRTGANYLPDPMDIKFLSAVNGVRHETRLGKSVAWDTQSTYTFRVSWHAAGISIYLDGEQVQQHTWESMLESFEYVFLGTNNVYAAQVGPIYSNLRIYRTDAP